MRESRATGSGIFVAPLFECSGEDDRGYIVAKRPSLRESSVLSFIANHANVATIMTHNVEIDGIDRVDKTAERSLLDLAYKRCPTSLQFNFNDNFPVRLKRILSGNIHQQSASIAS